MASWHMEKKLAPTLTARDVLDLARAAFERHGPKDEPHQLSLVPFKPADEGRS